MKRSAFARGVALVGLAGDFLSRSVVGKISGTEPLWEKHTEKLVQELRGLRGAAMKVGQFVALEGQDFLPKEVIGKLQLLQDKALFMDFSEVQEVLDHEWKIDWRKIVELEPTPLAAASIGQVHRVKLPGGIQAVAKIQYPGISETVESDLKILTQILGVASLGISRGKLLNASELRETWENLLGEVREVFLQETDFEQEARALERYASQVPKISPLLYAPHPILEWSTKRVLVMEEVKGLSFQQALLHSEFSPHLRTQAARSLLELHMTEFLDWGILQSDPNPGNYRIRLGDFRVELLDFGAVVELPLEFRRLYAELFRTGLLGEQERFLDTARKLGVWNTGESEAAGQALWDLVRACMTAFEREEFDFTDRSYMEVAVERSRVLMKHLRRSTPTRHVLFLHRKLGGLFQIFKQLEVKLDLRPEREKLLKWLQQEGG